MPAQLASHLMNAIRRVKHVRCGSEVFSSGAKRKARHKSDGLRLTMIQCETSSNATLGRGVLAWLELFTIAVLGLFMQASQSFGEQRHCNAQVFADLLGLE